MTSPTGSTASELTPAQLAADESLFELWDRATPFPAMDEMLDLDVVTHVSVERAVQGQYHYLHETALAWHKGVLYCCFANHPLGESNQYDELIRGTRSTDGGLTWETPQILAQPPLLGAQSINHPVLFSHQGKLWGFFTCFNDEVPRTEVFRLDEATQKWEPQNTAIAGFIPFAPPQKMRDGNWIMGGEEGWPEAAVAISHGDDFTQWDFVRLPRPEDMTLQYPEVAIVNNGDELLAICRPHRDQQTAPVSVSKDCGRTWTTLSLSNFPLWRSQPGAGTLSTGQYYLITNNYEGRRPMLTIAVTRPGERKFSRVWKIRHQSFPRCRLFPGGVRHGQLTKDLRGNTTQWSYPSAVEHEGKLYISYTHGKEDAVLSIIPVRVLGAS